MTYDDFLLSLYRAPHATACDRMQRLAGHYGKSVRDVSADFRSKFGTHL